jgi:hypothetical protein
MHTHAAAEQEKLKGEAAATLALLDELTNEAQGVVTRQAEAEGAQAAEEAALAEVAARLAAKQKEVRCAACVLVSRCV